MGVSAPRRDLVFAVGERGTVARFDGEAWAFEDTPTRELLRDVWATGEAAWAVGEGGTILQRGEDGWTLSPSATERGLRAVWGRSADEVYAVGEAGAVVRFDGTSWSPETIPTALVLEDVWGPAEGSAVFALAVDGRARASLFERGDEGWRELETVDGDLAALGGGPDGRPFLVGAEARHWTTPGGGTALASHRAIPLDLDRPVNAAWTAPDGAALAVGYDGRIARFDGTRWSRMTSPATTDLYAIDGTAPDDVWAVGVDGLVLRFDGTEWTRQGDGITAHLEGVWGSGPRDVWVVGDRATLHFDGNAWSAEGPSEHHLHAIGGVAGVLFAVGDGGAVWRRENGAWRAEHRDADYELDGVFGSDQAHAFVVGKTVWLEHEDGEWREHRDRPPASGVWGASSDDVWVAGSAGLHHWDGSRWTPVESTADQTMFAVWGAGREDVWAVGAQGRLLHYDGRAWSEQGAPTAQNLLAVWGSGADDVWAVGQHGTILHYDGSAWRWRDSGTDHLLHAVWGSSASDVWVIGHGGVILHYAG